MPDPNFFILFVEAPEASARFYADLLGKPPLEASPTFAMFALDSGAMLGLWSRHTAEPVVGAAAGSCELAFALDSDAEVERTHRAWQQRALPMLQAPTRMDFGYTFVARDPDGHRLRVFSPVRD